MSSSADSSNPHEDEENRDPGNGDGDNDNKDHFNVKYKTSQLIIVESFIEYSTVEVLRRYTSLTPRILITAENGYFAGYDYISNSWVMIKKICKPFRDVFRAKRAYKELKFMRSVNHVSLPRLIDIFMSPIRGSGESRDLYLVREYEPYSLHRTITESRNHEQISWMIDQLLCGIKHLNSAGMVSNHTGSSIIGYTRSGRIQIYGCEYAAILRLNLSHEDSDTANYSSPETNVGIFDERCEPKSAVFSIGCALAEMATSSLMFQENRFRRRWKNITTLLGTPSSEFIDRVPNGFKKDIILASPRREPTFDRVFSDANIPPDSEKYPQLNSVNARDLLARMLVIDPRHRISVDEALKHPYIKLWYRKDEVDAPPPDIGDNLTEGKELTIQQYERLIYNEVKDYNVERVLTPIRFMGGNSI